MEDHEVLNREENITKIDVSICQIGQCCLEEIMEDREIKVLNRGEIIRKSTLQIYHIIQHC